MIQFEVVAIYRRENHLYFVTSGGLVAFLEGSRNATKQ